MPNRFRRCLRSVAAAAALALVLVTSAACATAVDGNGTLANAANANLDVKGGDSSSAFDQLVENSLFDVEAFWKTNYPSVSGGKQLVPLKGGLYSVDGAKVVAEKRISAPATDNACIRRSPASVIDNGAFCRLDDSILWDRAKSHLFAQLAAHYGPLMVGLFFAHEFGHAISFRLGVFDQNLPTIDTESQADCAAGAWVASALKHQAPHFRDTTPEDLDDALEGYLDARDDTPGTPDQVSHGNGFDRLSALADGIAKGPTFCFAKNYFDRTFTERPFTSEADYQQGGNQPLSSVTDTSANNLAVRDLNRYWTKAAKTVPASFPKVSIKQADHPACGPSAGASFGYCPDDNTVYFSTSFARKAYYSFPIANIDSTSAEVTLQFNQPADNALGTLVQVGWGFAVRDKVFHKGMSSQQALVAAICYTGAYAKDINLSADPDAGTANQRFILLSPADLDESVSILLNRDLMDQSFGTLDTTGLDRVQAFVKGYKQGLSSC